ncbi:MAG: heme exporter protein CcmD [Thiohalocapsa sp.]
MTMPVTTVIGDWVAMGGYAAFVWPAYAVAGCLLGGLALHSWQRHRRSARELVRLQRRSGPGSGQGV